MVRNQTKKFDDYLHPTGQITRKKLRQQRAKKKLFAASFIAAHDESDWKKSVFALVTVCFLQSNQDDFNICELVPEFSNMQSQKLYL